MSEKSRRRDRIREYIEQPYVKAIDRAVRAGAVPMIPGTLSHLFVFHDDDCMKLRGGLCSCAPDLEVRYEPAKGGAA